MTSPDVHKRILFVALKKEAQPVLGQLRAAGHEVSLVEDLDEAQVLLGSGAFDQSVLAASNLASVLEHRLLWESTDTDAWRRSTSAIAHDLRSLLLALERSVELQEDERRREGMGSEFSDIRHTISTLSSFLQELTIELDNGVREQLNLTSVDLEDVVETAAMAAYPSASERRQKLVIDIHEEVRKVRADSTKLKRVLTGLLQYASRHTPNRGTVKVRAYQEHHDCVISVCWHTGSVLTRSELRDLFSPVTDKDTSAGMGLPRVEKLVAQHGGRLWIESEKGSGTTVFISLPLLADELDRHTANLTRG